MINITKEFFLFLLIGAIAASVNFYSRIIISQWYSYSISIFISYLAGMFTFYILARSFVFKESNQKIRKSIIYFVFINFIAILQIWLIAHLFLDIIFPLIEMHFYPQEISHALGIIFPIFSSYFGHKYLSFKKNKIWK